MRHDVLLDTGPLVAFLNQRDQHHDWAASHWREVVPPLLTSESVLSEACFLLQVTQGRPEWVLDLVARKAIRPVFAMDENAEELKRLMVKYRDVPMSLADASLVRMSETHARSVVFTIDDDFQVYRRHGRQVIPLLCP